MYVCTTHQSLTRDLLWPLAIVDFSRSAGLTTCASQNKIHGALRTRFSGFLRSPHTLFTHLREVLHIQGLGNASFSHAIHRHSYSLDATHGTRVAVSFYYGGFRTEPVPARHVLGGLFFAAS